MMATYVYDSTEESGYWFDGQSYAFGGSAGQGCPGVIGRRRATYQKSRFDYIVQEDTAAWARVVDHF
ncbi:hypothetical protein NDU88_001847 [Pleurodeles waltl]|uniref:Uncharacterized protein n=1 Tax=Pleurodeles waltl TaxID=8319 RepID=A0AAV7LAT4_PLEWA|nr:hypothetical protein NDU88_001847 [Pleurodeles waltl]